MDLMSEALCKCECLTYLCANDARFGDQGSDASLIRRALNEIFGEGTVPTVSVDSWAVVSHPWVFFSHPWAVFYQSGSNFPEKGFSEYRVFPVQSDG
uniref:Uncharacterized protein n=1 Tax=Ditylenchus dipsaci TaxID=166011 RepID=A0A915EHJ7_9BILA